MAKSKFFKKPAKHKKSFKLEKKFFIILGAILGIIILGIGIFFLYKYLSKEELIIKDNVTFELNGDKPEKKDFFKKYRNVSKDKVTIDLDGLDLTEIGEYDVTVSIKDDKEYTVHVSIKDTTPPKVEVKNVTINEGETYSINDFIKSCEDNSKVTCNVKFENEDDELKEKAGTYKIKIVIYDNNGNEITKEVTLKINGENQNPDPIDDPDPVDDPKPKECKFGNDKIKTKTGFVISYNVAKDGCAEDKNNMEKEDYLVAVRELAEEEIAKLQKEVTPAITKEFPRNKYPKGAEVHATNTFTAVLNEDDKGLVGYCIEIQLYVKAAESDEELVLKEDYYLYENGTRKYITNEYKLK